MSSDSAEKAVGLTKILGRRLPPSKVSFLGLIVVSFAIGALAGAMNGAAGIGEEAIRAVFLIAVPAGLGAVCCISLKRRIKYKKILFLSLVSAAIYGIFYVLHFGGVAQGVGFDAGASFNLLLLGNALVFALWYVTARIVFDLKYMSFLFGLMTPTLNVMFLLADMSLAVGSPEAFSVLGKLYFASFIFLAAIFALFWMINAPMKRNFGVSMTEAASLFLAQWFDQSPKLEGMFDRVGESIWTMVGVMAFRAKGRLKAVFIVPHVHFGPFGSLGGSEFPTILADEVAAKTGALGLVFHGFATHDFNPVASSEADRFNSAIMGALGRMKFAKARGRMCFGKSGGSRSKGVLVNGSYFSPLSRAPRTTEDVDFSVGLALRNYALAKGAKEAILFDAHNAETGEIMRIESGNPIAFEYMEAVGNALEAKGKEGPLRLGVAYDPLKEFGITSGVGPAGLKVAVFEANRKKYAMVLVDANGAVPEFRREVIDLVLEMGMDECELMTTDTHSVNRVGGVLNPVGGPKTDRKALLARIRGAVGAAERDISEVEAASSLEKVDGVRVFGVAQSSELLGTVNSIVAVVRVVAPLLLIAAVAVALWIMTKV